MSDNDIPLLVKDFLFHSIDSVEQLEVLLWLFQSEGQKVTAEELSQTLRSSPNSVQQRLNGLLRNSLVIVERADADAPEHFYFNAESPSKKIVYQLIEVYKTHRYRVLEIIFSPLKKSRHFADAFRISNKDPKGGRNG
ncbi:MAG: MarR family transcriptional regulator [Proteobacteria bacterium]|nr:MAG: MarR family transcriptional regulator [Pseudomonadota bacterium]